MGIFTVLCTLIFLNSNADKSKDMENVKKDAWGKTWYNTTLPDKDRQADPIFWDFEPDSAFVRVPSYTVAWQWGAPTSGPGSANSGINCWATNLSGNYTDNADWTLTIPAQDLSGTTNPGLYFYHWYYTETGYDSGWVEISTNSGSSWIKISQSYGGTSGAWVSATVDLSSYAGLTDFLIRFRFMSDGSINYAGWYIDDVSVGEISLTNNIYETSFESDAGDLSEYVIGDSTAPWEWGAPSTGPGAAFHGNNCWATNLSGNYKNYADAGIRNGTNLNLQSASYAELNFFHWYNTESGYDSGWVEISTSGQNGPWFQVSPTYRGLSSGWLEGTVDISPYTATNQFRFRFRFKSDGSITYDGWFIDSVRISLGSTTTLNSYDFEINNGGFVPDPPASDLNEWHCGTPTTGPGAAYSGVNCWGTDLDGNYENNANWVIMTPICDLTGWTVASLQFANWHNTEAINDLCTVDVSDDSGSTWTSITSYSGNSSGWLAETLDVSPFISPGFRVRFVFTSDGSGINDGWFIDDVKIDTTGGMIFYDPIKIATNWIAMYVSNDSASDPGTYTSATELAHTYGEDVTLLYGGEVHNPWSSYNTVRSHATNTDYVTRSSGALTETNYTVGQLSNYYRGAQFLRDQRLQQTWSVQNGQDDFELRQVIYAAAWDDSSRLGVLWILKNFANQARDFGFRYEWDIHVYSEDSPYYRSFDSPIPSAWEPYETKWTDFTTLWYGETCEDGAGRRHFITIREPTYWNPPPTVPDTLFYVRWAGTYGAYGNAFQVPYMDDGIADSMCGDWDAALCYMWTNRTVASDDSIIFAQYLFSPVDSIVIVGAQEHTNSEIYTHPTLCFANPVRQGCPMILYGPAGVNVEMKLYSVDGRLIKDMFQGNIEPGGVTIRFNAHDMTGRKLSNGTYFIVLKSDDAVTSHKIIFLK